MRFKIGDDGVDRNGEVLRLSPARAQFSGQKVGGEKVTLVYLYKYTNCLRDVPG